MTGLEGQRTISGQDPVPSLHAALGDRLLSSNLDAGSKLVSMVMSDTL